VSCYDVLGVAPSATRAEITAAYRRLAKALHPDAHPGASATEQRARVLAMVRLNLAYEACQGRANSTVAAAARADAPIVVTPDGTCDICGATAHVHCHVDVGSTWMNSTFRSAPRVDLCAPCARALDLGMNVPAAPEESATEGLVATAAAGAGPTRRSTLTNRLRIAVLIAAAVVLGVVAFATPRGDTPVPLTGRCVQWSGGYSTVSCAGAHAGKIVGTAATPSACAARSSFVRYQGKVYCIDTSR
jgi:hypothetical protein